MTLEDQRTIGIHACEFGSGSLHYLLEGGCRVACFTQPKVNGNWIAIYLPLQVTL